MLIKQILTEKDPLKTVEYRLSQQRQRNLVYLLHTLYKIECIEEKDISINV